MTKIIFIAVISLFLNIYGQVNTEKHRTPDDLEGIAGFLEIGGTVKSGNTKKTQGNLDGRLDWKRDVFTTFLVFETEHEWVSGNRISGNGLIHLRNVAKIQSGLFTEVFGQLNYDKSLLINKRILVGGGLRYKIFKFDEGDFTIGNSYMYEDEKYELAQDAIHPLSVGVSRWSNYLSVYFRINSSVVFGAVTYYQPAFSEFSDYRVLSENSLLVSLSKTFSISINFRLRHDSKPPDGIKKTDARTNFGIGVKF